MDSLVKCQQFIQKFANCKIPKTWCWTPERDAAEFSYNEFLLLIKPEVFEDIGTIGIVFEKFAYVLANFDVELVSIKLMPKEYVKEHTLIDKNYPTLNSISKLGWNRLPSNKKKLLSEVFFGENRQILGGDQLIQMFSNLTPLKLGTHCDKNGTKKLGSGIYVCEYSPYIVLNGFYPYQREYLSNGMLLACIARSNKSWSMLRRDMVGTIDPAKAALGSLRRVFYDNKLGVDGIARNGFHISPGPIEAITQIQNFFSEVNSPSSILKNLTKNGLGQKEILNLLSGHIKNLQNLFEATEDLNTEEALALCKNMSATD